MAQSWFGRCIKVRAFEVHVFINTEHTETEFSFKLISFLRKLMIFLDNLTESLKFLKFSSRDICQRENDGPNHSLGSLFSKKFKTNITEIAQIFFARACGARIGREKQSNFSLMRGVCQNASVNEAV